MVDKKKKKNNKEKLTEESFLTFFIKVKDGQYAPIEESSIKYARLSDLNDAYDLTNEEYYLYGVS